MGNPTNDSKNEKYEKFVSYIIELCNRDKKATSDLRRSINSNLSYKGWEYLVKFNIDIEKERDRIIYSHIASNIARNKIEKDGKDSIGIALKKCYDDEEQGKSKLMRLLSCDNYKELCSILRYQLPFIEEKAKGVLSYSKLLEDIIFFGENVKSKWASDYYKKSIKDKDNDINED